MLHTNLHDLCTAGETYLLGIAWIVDRNGGAIDLGPCSRSPLAFPKCQFFSAHRDVDRFADGRGLADTYTNLNSLLAQVALCDEEVILIRLRLGQRW